MFDASVRLEVKPPLSVSETRKWVGAVITILFVRFDPETV